VIGCKRILLTNAWYPALVQPNVELVIEGLAEVRGNTLIGSSGTEAEVDALLFATGLARPIPRLPTVCAARTAEPWPTSGRAAPKPISGAR
jgi:cation diffusion facilitator CzcD-associated flavoprotein CzcO